MNGALEVSGDGSVRRWSRADLSEIGDGAEVPVRLLLPDSAGATHASFESVAGDYRASIPLDVVRSQGVVLVGEDLRLHVRNGRTLCWNVKDLGSIRLTVGSEEDSVPENPPH